MNACFLNAFEIEIAKTATHANKIKNRKQNEQLNDFLDNMQQIKIIKSIFNM